MSLSLLFVKTLGIKHQSNENIDKLTICLGTVKTALHVQDLEQCGTVCEAQIEFSNFIWLWFMIIAVWNHVVFKII